MRRWIGQGLVLAMVVGGAVDSRAHPLDALTADEINDAVAILRAQGHVDAATRVAQIALDEPSKADVLAWQPRQRLPRHASVVVRRDRTVYEGSVDLTARRVTAWQAVPDVQSSILIEEWDIARQLTQAAPAWRAAMHRRGYDDGALAELSCVPLAAGPSTEPAEAGRRLLRVVCFDPAGDRLNPWGRPIEGVTATVDLDARAVVRVLDTGPVPMRRDVTPPIRSTPTSAPASTKRTATVANGEVRWAGWAFRFRIDRRAGLILSLVRRLDGGRTRMVLYSGSVAELYVPYMDPDPSWSFRNTLDVGEFGLGLLSSTLRAGIDCPHGARFFDAVLPDDRGRPVIGRSVACLFERDTGAPLWRHAEVSTGAHAGRAATELVLRTIPSVGNYDYVIDWVLTEAGAIRVDVGATGIDAVKGVATRSLQDATAPADTAHGALVAPHRVAVNHDHFVSLRLDLDVDGAANTLMRQRLTPRRADGRSLWTVEEAPVVRDGPLTDEHGGASTWRIINPTVTTALGQHPGYELRLGHGATALRAPDDDAPRRARFADAPLWVTAYDARERYAAGPYPNQNAADAGVGVYAARQRPVEAADLVLWCTLGFHHLPRPEDWPVLPTVWHSVTLVPYGFFDRNPGLPEPRARAVPAK